MTEFIYSVAMTDSAENDLTNIRDYLAEHRSLEDAYSLLVAVLDRIHTLERLPLRGSVVPEAAEVGNRELRQILHLPYRLIYRVAADTVTIIAIFDGRRDVQTLLKQRLLISQQE